MRPRIALFDIETAPSLGYVWAKWQTDVIDFRSDWYILSFAYKWLDNKKITTRALPDFPLYGKDRENDRELLVELWKVFDEADVIVGHNSDKFDIRKAYARFLVHGLAPPSPYKTVDTLKLARKHFKFDSNRLDDLGRYLGVGRKVANTGKHLWFGCMSGDTKSWATMRRYNARDVELLERVYLKLRPWTTTHPNLAHLSHTDICGVCQSSKIQHRGWNHSRTGKRARIQCTDCGAWGSRGPFVREAA